MENKRIYFYIGIFRLLYPLFGVAFFFLKWNIGLYICAVIGALIGILRFSKRDFWTLLWAGISVTSASIFFDLLNMSFWPVAAVLFCLHIFLAYLLDILKFMKALRYIRKLETELGDPSYVAVNILDSSGGLSMEEIMFTDEDSPEPLYRRTEEWIIGKDISYEKYMNLRDPGTNQMYLIIFFDQGEKKYHFVTKSAWDRFASRIESLLLQSDLP